MQMILQIFQRNVAVNGFGIAHHMQICVGKIGDYLAIGAGKARAGDVPFFRHCPVKYL